MSRGVSSPGVCKPRTKVEFEAPVSFWALETRSECVFIPLDPRASLGPLRHKFKQLQGSVASQPRLSCWPLMLCSTSLLSTGLLIELNSFGSLGEDKGQKQSPVFMASGVEDKLDIQASVASFLSISSEESASKSSCVILGRSEPQHLVGRCLLHGLS